jgi:hypothetical protein
MNKVEFIEFTRKLRIDYEQNTEKWESKTIPEYLESIERYTEDIQGYYDNINQNINSDNANWKIFAVIMKGASIYE